MKYRFHLHHLMTDKHFYGVSAEMSDSELKGAQDFAKTIATEGNYFSYENSDGDTVILPKEILRNSVFYIEKVGA